ncbi:MAG: hypothetical protein LC714_06625 [Actinobacteria bacterium]|nr:hypothetical protein [Actinomycetota bacterium]
MNDVRKRTRGDLPIACSLPWPEETRRREEVGKIFEGCLRADELEDGYEFRFPGDREWAVRLAEFIAFERECCPFFSFELFFEPGGGSIRLQMRGPEGAKEIVATMVTDRAG